MHSNGFMSNETKIGVDLKEFVPKSNLSITKTQNLYPLNILYNQLTDYEGIKKCSEENL